MIDEFMTSVSVGEFKKFCKQHGFKRYIYATENNNPLLCGRRLQGSFEFKYVDVLLNPNSICFFNKGRGSNIPVSSYICINCVKYITVETLDTDGDLYRHLITITCLKYGGNVEEEYMVIAE